MLDLRKVVNRILNRIAVKIKPSDSKQKDFHLALSEYLYKELKHEGMNVTKQNVLIKVSLKSKIDNKYEHIIIDCLEGKMFLRGKEVKDKYFGKLRRFESGTRTSDAYHCVVQSAKRIINRIKKLEEVLKETERVVEGNINFIDLRKSTIVSKKDLRKVSKIDLRKSVQINKRDLRKHAQINRRDLRKINRRDLRKINRIDLRK